MKIARQLAALKSAADAMDQAAARAIAEDQVWHLEMTKWTFDDNSVLAIRAGEMQAIDADDAVSIRAYGKWIGDDEQEQAEVERLLEALGDRSAGQAQQFAILDTGAGCLQWIGAADSAADAVRRHADDIGLADETIDELLVGEITDEQAAALNAWWRAGGHASDFPVGVELHTLSADEVRAALKP